MYSNIFSSEIRQQNRTEQNRTEPLQGFLRSQNRTEQNRTEQNRTEQNRTITKLILLQKKILQSLFQSFNRTIISYTKQNIIFNYFKFFMPFSKFLNAHPSGHKARGYAFLSLSNTGFDFRTTPLLFNFKIKKIFFALLSFLILFTISCGNENKTKNEIYERNISYYAGDWINSDTKEKIFIINSNGSIIVNGENILPKSIKKNSETNYTFKVMPEWIKKSSYTFNINFINNTKGKVNVGNLYFEINKIN